MIRDILHLLLAALFLIPTLSHAAPYEIVEKYTLDVPSTSPSGNIVKDSEIVVGGDGRVYVPIFFRSNMAVIDPATSTLTELELDIASINHITKAGDGLVYATITKSDGAAAVLRFNPDNSTELIENSKFGEPFAISGLAAFGPYLYIETTDDGVSIIRYNLETGEAEKYPPFGVGAGILIFDMATDGEGNLWMPDPSRNRLIRMTPEGAFSIVEANAAVRPNKIAADNQGNIVTGNKNTSGPRISGPYENTTVISPDGTLTPVIQPFPGSRGPGIDLEIDIAVNPVTGFIHPMSLAVIFLTNAKGNIFGWIDPLENGKRVSATRQFDALTFSADNTLWLATLRFRPDALEIFRVDLNNPNQAPGPDLRINLRKETKLRNYSVTLRNRSRRGSARAGVLRAFISDDTTLDATDQRIFSRRYDRLSGREAFGPFTIPLRVRRNTGKFLISCINCSKTGELSTTRVPVIEQREIR